jgi:hypothetical protein
MVITYCMAAMDHPVSAGLIRGGLFAVATAVNRGSAFLIRQSFLSPIDAIKISSMFGRFAMFCGVAWTWMFYRVPGIKDNLLNRPNSSGKGHCHADRG